MIISLTGFMGSGKSSVGRRLAELLCCRFMDLDEIIEEKEGRRIPEIFATDGEASFRRMELEALKMTIESAPDNLVLALGGGTVMTAECAELIHGHTFCIYLRASVDTLAKNLEGEAEGRPMLQSPANDANDACDALRTRISSLMSLRAPTYQSAAHLIIDTDGKSIEEISESCISVCK